SPRGGTVPKWGRPPRTQIRHRPALLPVFFFNDTATTEIYTLSLHERSSDLASTCFRQCGRSRILLLNGIETNCSFQKPRSEEHTSELQSHSDLVCRLLL